MTHLFPAHPLPQYLLCDGAKVSLWSKQRGAYMRITDDGSVSAKPNDGDNMEFNVHERDGTWSFESMKDGKWLRIHDGVTDGKGSGGALCNFDIHPHDDGTVSFESHKSSGQHIGIEPNGDLRPATETGRGPRSRFIVALLEKGKNQLPLPNPGRLLVNGSVINLISRASGMTIRRTAPTPDCNDVDGKGYQGDWAQFIVHVKGPGIVAFQAKTDPEKWLRINDNCLNAGGRGGKFCHFYVHGNEDHGFMSLESVEHRAQHIGILPNGDPKEPEKTGRGIHGQFLATVTEQGGDVGCTAEVPKEFVSQQALSNKSVVHLWARGNGSYLWVNEDGDLLSNGDTSKKSEFKVELKGDTGRVLFVNEKYENRYIRVTGSSTDAKGSGGGWCDYKVIRRNGLVAFESNEFPGKHIGVRPNGEIKPPQETGTGIHGQFFVVLDEAKKFQLPCTPPSALLEDGAEVRLLSRSAGRAIKLVGDGELTCSESDSSKASVFIVRKKDPGMVAFQCAADESKWLRLNQPDDTLDLKGHGGKWCHFYVYSNDELGTAIFESREWRDMHVGIQSDGAPKAPSTTRRGKNAQFYVIPAAQ